MFEGTKYATCFPIGTMEVVMNFKPQTLRDYYEKWDRPEMCIRDRRKRLTKILAIPYVGRIDFLEKKENSKVMPIYIAVSYTHL